MAQFCGEPEVSTTRRTTTMPWIFRLLAQTDIPAWLYEKWWDADPRHPQHRRSTHRPCSARAVPNRRRSLSDLAPAWSDPWGRPSLLCFPRFFVVPAVPHAVPAVAWAAWKGPVSGASPASAEAERPGPVLEEAGAVRQSFPVSALPRAEPTAPRGRDSPA